MMKLYKMAGYALSFSQCTFVLKYNYFQLILYWYGVPHQETGMNMSTCIWQSRELATESASHPCHAKAMRLAAEVYDVYSLERYVLRKKKGEEGVTLEAYMGGEVGW